MLNKVEIVIHLLGKAYPIKCAQTDVAALEQAARYLENKMRAIQQGSKTMGGDSVAVLAALNLAHEFLSLQEKAQYEERNMQVRINELYAHIKDRLEVNSPEF